MQQQVTVKKIIGADQAEVSVTRASACGHDCGSCGGCGAPTEVISVVADNIAGARQGDHVIIESNSAKILSAAFLLYIVPFILFFLFYYAGYSVVGGFEALMGIAGFAVGIVICIIYSRRLNHKKKVQFRIVSIIGDG